jgi:hypothetical protein
MAAVTSQIRRAKRCIGDLSPIALVRNPDQPSNEETTP